MTEREAFEAVITAPPFEREIGRFDDRGAWPGSYLDYEVQLACDVWQAACAWQRERDAKLCEAYAIDRHALYKGRPPYTGKEPQRYDPYTEGASDAADFCADKIRSGA